MRKLGSMFVLTALCAVVALMSGCGSNPGPVSWGNLVDNYPPRVRGIAVNLEASLVVVDYQPKDARVEIQGWFVIPSDPEGASRRGIRFADDVISGSDSMTGRANFVIASYDWPDGWSWHGEALHPEVTYFFMIGIEDPDGVRTSITTWKYKGGALTQIS